MKFKKSCKKKVNMILPGSGSPSFLFIFFSLCNQQINIHNEKATQYLASCRQIFNHLFQETGTDMDKQIKKRIKCVSFGQKGDVRTIYIIVNPLIEVDLIL